MEFCKWDAEKKQSRTAARVHIGRLCDDNSIRPGKIFLEKFPEYHGRELYYYENKLLDREGYLKANPEAQQQWDELEKEAEKPIRPCKIFSRRIGEPFPVNAARPTRLVST